LATRREDEGRISLAYLAGLIYGTMDLTGLFKEHRTRRVHGYTPVAVKLGYRSSFHYNNDWPGVCVPARVRTRLKYKLGLQDIRRRFLVHADALGAAASRQKLEAERSWPLGVDGANVYEKSSDQSASQ
jgi:hypothetical protein